MSRRTPVTEADRESPTGVPGVVADRNEAPWAPPEELVARAARQAARDVHRYPLELTDRVRAAVARHFEVDEREIVLTNGVDEAVDLCLLEFGAAMTPWPGFGGFLDRAGALGVPVTRLHARQVGDGLRWVEPAVTEPLLLVASPGNPLPGIADSGAIEELLCRGAAVLLDETYGAFASRPLLGSDEEIRRRHPNLMIFRSFSKSYGVAGLRVGALIGAAPLAGRLRDRQAYLSIGRFTLEILEALLQAGSGYRDELVRHVRHERARMRDALVTTGVFAEIPSSHTNFLLCLCGSPLEASRLGAWLRQHGIAVCMGESHGVPDGVRITVCTQAENDAIIGAVHAFARQTEGPVTQRTDP